VTMNRKPDKPMSSGFDKRIPTTKGYPAKDKISR